MTPTSLKEHLDLDKNTEDLLVPKTKKVNESFKYSLITTYSNQHYDVKKIIQNHWNVLKGHRVLGSTLPDIPRVVCRGVPPLKLQLAPNVVDPAKHGGYFPCRKCPICKLNASKNRRTESFQSTSTQEIFSIKPFIVCSTKYVVYIV